MNYILFNAYYKWQELQEDDYDDAWNRWKTCFLLWDCIYRPEKSKILLGPVNRTPMLIGITEEVIIVNTDSYHFNK